jgi:prepilin-type N-terminal cleavage/methylation domain-containing protein
MKLVGHPFTRSTASKQNQKGFSLVELMVVVAIIGILAALAVPRFQTFQAKARQSEAKVNLAHIYTLQSSYYGDNTTYVSLGTTIGPGACTQDNPLGFKLTDCSKVRYSYTTPAANATTFTAQAINSSITARVNPSCPGVNDTWTINQLKDLQNTVNATTAAGC